MMSTSSSTNSCTRNLSGTAAGALSHLARGAGLLATVLALALVLGQPGCSKSSAPPATQDGKKTVVIYTALDRMFSEPILKDFERQTGIRVDAVYDAEAAKTTGLVNRLIARRANPDCDVFWNNELLQIERLAQKGLLAEYRSPSAERIPARFRDPQGRWTGFAARARVIIINTNLVPAAQMPTGLKDFLDPRWKGRAAIGRPFFGTTLTHMVILDQAWGRERLTAFLGDLRGNQVSLCTGNATVRDLVAGGERAFGLTDTDDAYASMQAGKPVVVRIPDPDQGAVLIPNSVALVAGAPHPAEARLLIDYLLSQEVERRLAQGPSAQVPLGTDLADLETPWRKMLQSAAPLQLDVARAAAAVENVVGLLTEQKMDQ